MLESVESTSEWGVEGGWLHSGKLSPKSLTPTPLALPFFDKSVPSEIYSINNYKSGFDVINRLFDLGLLSDDEVDNGNSLAGVIETGIRNIFKTFDEKYTYPLDVNLMNDLDDKSKEANFLIFRKRIDRLELSIEPLFDYFNKELNGLGEAYFNLLINEVSKTKNASTPAFIFYACSRTHWLGEDDESEYIQMIQEEDEEVNVEDMEIYTRANFDEDFPKVFQGLGGRVTLSSLKLIIKGAMCSNKMVSNLCSGLLAIYKLKTEQIMFYESTHTANTYEESEEDFSDVIFHWNDDSATYRVLDDYYNLVSESSDLKDYFLSVNINAISIEELAILLPKIEKHLIADYLINHLVTSINVAQNSII